MSRTVFSPPAGPLRGWLDDDVVRVTGVRYALAERFQPPVPAPDRTEIVDALEWSPSCPQLPSPALAQALGPGVGDLPQDEHCQRLSITLPADLREGETLPVMVWIHGGSYTTGSGDLPIMDPAPLVAEQRVIVVTVTYRLGLFGYLGSGEGRPANLGLLDQIEAFRWVQRNIAAFGGDPERVTAFGESAGGDAVAHLMTVPEARELFSRAIVQSAPLGIIRGRERMNAAMAEAAAEIDATTPAAEVIALEEEVEAAAAPFGLIRSMPFGVQYGHAPLPREEELTAVWKRAAADFDLLIGHTAQEARLFLHRVPALARIDRVPLVGSWITAPLVRLVTELVYARDARRFARRHSRAGGRVWRYRISWSAPGNRYGSAHTVDLPLLFGRRSAWTGAGLLEGADWDDLQAAAGSVRKVWGDFAHGRTWRRVEVPGVLRVRRG